MGSLRNPVGPLPSSIYWRRRAVVATVIALLVALAVWLLGSGGTGSRPGDDANAGSPAPSITPGPSLPGPAISTQPGGRDESGTSGGSGGSAGTGGSAGGGSDAGKGGDPGAGTAAGSGADAGAGSGAGGGSGSARRVPADSPLPDCPSGALRLTLRSTEVSYAPDEKPRFRLTVRNTSASACKTDLGPATAVLTVSDRGGDEIWSSEHCPGGPGSVYVAVPAGGTVVHTIEWDRRHSAPRCATPPARTAGPGTYLAEVTVPGVKGVLRSAITLARD
ncbi:hypothetical protein LUX12_10730 [Streptomyces somaliensis]|uniref:hypothetical protein n=1 Tax=Streptomyces somaliensis TaxID=78355 RepID=UPI0020CBD34D|nr:hypothetical protein [Streptomyces somaliensis]MCP9945144.1 hypothetical protein [Streptomyces somaliensis]MCP9974452.1 hypothetical protein [Streptomyces somaliensis]